MRRVGRAIGAALLFVLVAVLLLPSIVPPFLDRVYYRGPPSDHFDGERFFNPGAAGPADRQASWPVQRMLRFWRGDGRASWPERVNVFPGKHPERVAGAAMRVTWIGHATVLVQTRNLNILTDPIYADVASPFPALGGPRRVRAPGIAFNDLPPIDLVLVSHNHYDHMDLATLRRLWARDRPLIVTSLGNETILRRAGIPAKARDWSGRIAVRPGVDVFVERVHHWGSRWFADRNRALWSGFTVTLPGGNLYFAGDTGFGDGEWPREARRRGPVRLAIIPIGAYLPRDMMRDNHLSPDEAVEVFERVGAARALGMHWGTFQLSHEPIDGPPRFLAETLRARGIPPELFRTIEAGRSWLVPALRE